MGWNNILKNYRGEKGKPFGIDFIKAGVDRDKVHCNRGFYTNEYLIYVDPCRVLIGEKVPIGNEVEGIY